MYQLTTHILLQCDVEKNQNTVNFQEFRRILPQISSYNEYEIGIYMYMETMEYKRRNQMLYIFALLIHFVLKEASAKRKWRENDTYKQELGNLQKWINLKIIDKERFVYFSHYIKDIYQS
jgi:hypothetical protein